LHDVLILLVVAVLAGLYSFTVHSWLTDAPRTRPSTADGPTRLERLGVSIVLGTLLLSVLNTFLTALLGSWPAAVAIPLLPLGILIVVGWRRRHEPGRLEAMGRLLVAAGWHAVVCTVCILAVAYQLFSLESLSSRGVFHPDLLWHVGRVAEQAFQSSPGSRPLSPIAFPDPLPYQSFVVDSLASATFRYLPFPLQAFTFCQVAFAWALVLWTAVVLIAGSTLPSSLFVLTSAVLLVPIAIWGTGSFGLVVTTNFHSNLNSLFAWEIGLGLAFHLYRAFRRGMAPMPAFVLIVPPASIFFKVNEAFAFAFLGILGILMCGGSKEFWRPVMKRSLVALALWAAAFASALALGRWPVSAGLRGSMDNFWHYAGTVLPDLKIRSGPQALGVALYYLGIVAGVGALATWCQLQFGRTRAPRGRLFRQNVVVPAGLLAAAMAYLFLGWWLVLPIGVAEGEPMHVNFAVVQWLITVPMSTSLCLVYESARRFARIAIIVATIGLWGILAWRLNTQPPGAGGLIAGPDYDVALERRLRAALSAQIPDGHCFAYNRRYVVYTAISGEFPPDFAIAATGCPQLNGVRWRGLLGNNDPETLARFSQIAVPAGKPYRVVVHTTCQTPEPPANFSAAVSGTTVSLSWTPVPGATSYQIEAGSKPGWSDLGILSATAEPALVATNVTPRLYFARVRAGNDCGRGGASGEIRVDVQSGERRP
jgi:hypothetical protein